MKTVAEAARLLAEEHRREDDEMRDVFWVHAPHEVRLIEVTAAITDRNEALPFRFKADGPDVPYPSVVIMLSPGDWERVEGNQLPLPPAFLGVRTAI